LAWRFSYFWIDDFNVFYWVQRLDLSLAQMLWQIANPLADAFRPVGMFVYAFLWRAFDLNPLPYHLVGWTLHGVNVILLYAVIAKITSSPYGAGVGALLFGFRANFTDIYWSFGTVFELLALLMMLLAVWVYASDMRFAHKAAVVPLLYLLAVKSKEMAITLPAVLLLYEICFRKHKRSLQLAALFSLLGVFGAAFAYSRLMSMGGSSPTDPYFMDFSVLTFGRGYGWYFDHLYGMRLRWGAWFIGAFFVTLFLIIRRERRGLFFIGYIFATLPPVIFMVNHRFEFFWYVPFLGVAGLAAVLVSAIGRMSVRYSQSKIAGPASILLLVLIAASHGWREWKASGELIENQKSLASEYERFVRTMQNIPQPVPNAEIYFRVIPRHFTPEILQSATQAALHRTDVSAKVVETFPDNCQTCVDFAR
jgi:hypothetical protein